MSRRRLALCAVGLALGSWTAVSLERLPSGPRAVSYAAVVAGLSSLLVLTALARRLR